MLTKLTLTIEESVVEKAKDYARGKSKSVSRIVEEYLKNLSEGSEPLISSDVIKSPITDSLTGMFADGGKDYKTMLEEAREERYG